ncbi:MAG: type II toxin-antitoxin system VapC family toxin [Deltaproteobacteria bacterium]|jgi:predicted nucleic acid-binding protein|nr:type II toxin-antitoxin system VapC family toxin [Deltaproteobacteria bacterium]
MNNSAILDTNILIDLLAGTLDMRNIKKNFPKYIAYASFMTRVELLSYPKITVDQENTIEQLFKVIKLIPYNEDIENSAILLRRKFNIKIPDAFIVATALAHNAILITNDSKLITLNWPALDVRSIITQVDKN